MRSKNNNVFKLSSYWRNWSRILFHDVGGTAQNNPIVKMRKQFNIPAYIRTIELELTAVNPQHVTDWRACIQYATIRCHCTPMAYRDIIVGTLPPEAIDSMEKWLTPEAIEILLHGDFLPYIDFDRKHEHSNGGAHFIDCYQRPVTFQQYLDTLRSNEGGDPSIMMHDVEESYQALVQDEESYQALVQDWFKKIDSLIIVNGLKEQQL